MCNVRARASHDSHLSPPPFPTLRPFDVPPSFRDVIDSFSRLIATAEAAAATVAAAYTKLRWWHRPWRERERETEEEAMRVRTKSRIKEKRNPNITHHH